MIKSKLAFAAIFVAASFAMSQTALAHNPEVSAAAVCVDGQPGLDFVSQSYLFAPLAGETNSIAIEVSVDNGPWTRMATGAYLDPTYSFGGTLFFPSGSVSVRVRARTDAAWLDGFPDTDFIVYAAPTLTEAIEANATVFALRTDCVGFCGDGITGGDETCDDGNDIDDDECRNDCTFCGDAMVDPSEMCDDGNFDELDGCRSDCTIPFCGDGELDPGEGCDDGNQSDGDGCDSNCMVETADCDLTVDKYCSVDRSDSLLCEAKIAATTLRYTGPDMLNATVSFVGGTGDALYENVDLTAGTVLTGQNGFTVDGRPGDLSAKTTIVLNGVVEVIHTSCSAIYVAGQPAPLDKPKGDPSPNWEVVNFVDKNGGEVSEDDGNSVLTSDCTIAVDKTSTKKKKGKKRSRKEKRKKATTSSISNKVTYTYVINNSGTVPAFDIVAIDDKLGELSGSPLDQLDPGESVELSEMTTITETTTNTVDVSGATAAGLVCEAAASATVTVVIPPASCATTGKPKALVFSYTEGGACPGTNTQDKDDCTGDTGAGVVAVSADEPTKVTSDVGTLSDGDSVTFTAVGNALPADVKVTVGGQKIKIHASCSQDLILGQSFGSLTLVGFIGQ